MHTVGETHDTPAGVMFSGLAIFCSCWIDQLEPFQCSTSAVVAVVFDSVSPTAVHAAARQETTSSRTSCMPPAMDGLGVRWINQREPFQRSANAALPPESPTAVHAVTDEQSTVSNSPPPLGVGVGTIDQLEPFHRSASVVPPVSTDPTAMQKRVDGHDTPESVPLLGPRRGWIRHPGEIAA
jgi:hypothetical protein